MSRPAPAGNAAPSRDGFDAQSAAFAALSGAAVVAGGIVAAVNDAAPFAHGSWLAAYLVLVVGASQVVLGLGPLRLPAPVPPARLRQAQLALWNCGGLAVPAGVLSRVMPLVAAGSLVLLLALACFSAGARGAPVGTPRCAIAYQAFVLVMAASVLVGAALAGSA